MDASDTGPLFTSAARVCAVCTRQFSRYKCPRCAIQYCSLGCYRAHSETCTEGFYADQATEALHSTRATPEQQVDMMRKLQRLEAAGAMEDGTPPSSEDEGEDGAPSDDDADDADDAGRVERLSRLLAQSSIDESELSAQERSEFRRLVADGSLAAQLSAAPAWWAQLPADAVGLARRGLGWAHSSADAAAAADAARAPAPPNELPTLASLTSRSPPAALRFTVLELVCAYVYTHRLFSSEPYDDPAHACAALLALSASLAGELGGAHGSAEEALLDFASRCDAAEVATSAAFGAACLADVATLLQSAGATALALADTTSLLSAGAKLCPRRKAADATSGGPADGSAAAAGGGGTATGAREALLRAKKKSRFVEVWWASVGMSEQQAVLAGLSFALRAELGRREEVRRAGAADDAGVAVASGSGGGKVAAAPGPPKPRRLVEEL